MTMSKYQKRSKSNSLACDELSRDEFRIWVIMICPSTWLRVVVSPSTLLRTVSLSNGLSNHLLFAIWNFSPKRKRFLFY